MSILSRDPHLSRKPPETHGNGRFSKRTMVGKNGESILRFVHFGWGWVCLKTQVSLTRDEIQNRGEEGLNVSSV